VKSEKRESNKHFKNEDFLQALGEHCRKQRYKKGYTVDRLHRESSKKLSLSVIHRLERGRGAITILSLLRYAQTLQLEPKDLLDFQYQASESGVKLFSVNDPQAEQQAFQKYLPVYTLSSAVEKFGSQKMLHQPACWIELNPLQVHEYTEEVFVCQIQGHAMTPKLQPGQYVAFRQPKKRMIAQDKIVLAFYKGPIDQETQGNYTIRVFRSSRIAFSEVRGRERQILLAPINPLYESLLLYPQSDHDFQVIGEFLFIVG